jgi:hypothetical protein
MTPLMYVRMHVASEATHSADTATAAAAAATATLAVAEDPSVSTETTEPGHEASAGANSKLIQADQEHGKAAASPTPGIMQVAGLTCKIEFVEPHRSVKAYSSQTLLKSTYNCPCSINVLL